MSLSAALSVDQQTLALWKGMFKCTEKDASRPPEKSCQCQSSIIAKGKQQKEPT